jgi:hypothetical protein
MCVYGPTGVRDESTPFAKISSGPCPSKWAAIGPPANAASRSSTMKTMLATATRSRLKRIQISSQ